MGTGAEIALLGAAGVGALSSISSGQAQKKQYKMQAGQAKLEAAANINDRTRALNEALATQNAMAGASGRTLSSYASVLEGDKKRYKQDVEMIKAGGAAQAGQAKFAGQSAQAQGILGAASGLAYGYAQTQMLK